MLTTRARAGLLFFSIALGALLPARVFAQATGSIAGVVTDQSGGVMPGVTIEAKNTATGQARNAVTGSDGYYALLQLNPGPYEVKATLSGFKPVLRQGIQVSAGDATPGGFGAATSGFSVNGMRNQSNNFLLDGASNNDTFNTGFVMRPPPDAIQEFKIQTHSYSAEFGRNSGSVVNVVTKSGTNVFHGAGWEFNRDGRFQARNFFAAPPPAPKPPLKQNQFGASLGGPVVKNTL